MLKNKFWMILILALVASALWVIVVLADSIYLPIVIREATVTPTFTPTPTETFIPTITPTPTDMPTPAHTPTRTPGVYIDDIVNGNSPNDVNDEYIKIVNTDDGDINLEGWRIRSEREPFFYTFPNFTLQDNSSVKIWTKSGTNTSSNLYMNNTAPVWNNVGDCGLLRDDGSGNGVLIDRLCYGSYGRLYPTNP